MRAPHATMKLCVSLAVALTAGAASAQDTPRASAQFEQSFEPQAAPSEHFVIAQLRNALRPWLTAPEQERLAAVLAPGTEGGNAVALRFLAADRALRAVVPLAMEMVARPHAAARLRSLAPVLDRHSAVLALRDRTLIDAAHHREELARLAAEGLARAMVRRGPNVRVQDTVGDGRELAADRALLAAVDAVTGREAADVAETVGEALHASGDTQQREAVFELVLGMVRDLAVLGRASREPVIVYRQPTAAALGDPEAEQPLARTPVVAGRRVPVVPGSGTCGIEFACGVRVPR